jgi:plastocyanin
MGGDVILCRTLMVMPDIHQQSTHRYLVWLAVLAILVLIASVLRLGSPRTVLRPVAATPDGTSIPSLTPAVQAQLAASHGFQYLVSYTGRGFEPATLTIKKGETVRFTNNSDEDLWVAATGASGKVYPAASNNECGQSAFDSCVSISRGGFWEFTFTRTGTWSYQNNRDTKMTAIITVK